MKKILMFCLTVLLTLSIYAQDQTAEVKKAVEDAYVKGIFLEGDAEAIKKGWHQECEIVMFYQNQIRKTPITYFIDRFTKKPGGMDKSVTHKFKDVRVTDYAAFVVVEIYSNGKHKYTDYLNLYKFEDGWKIATKTYFDADYKPMKKRTAVKPDLSVFKNYIGKYQGIKIKSFSFEIIEENGKCFVVFEKQGKIEIYPERQDFYFMKVDDVQIEFKKSGNEINAVFNAPGGKRFEVKKL